MPDLDRGSYRIHYRALGPDDAPPLLLVMGMGFSSRAWSPLPERLAGRHRVILFDNRGTGRSTRGRGLFRIRDLAEDAVAVLDATGVDRAAVFGISMGGMTALELVLGYPGRVRALVLGCTFAGWLRSRKASPRVLLEVAAAHLGRPGTRFRSLARFLVSRSYYETNGEEFRRWVRQVEPAGPLVGSLQARAVALHRTERRLSRIEVPTLVLTGDADRLVPPQNSRRLARAIPGARLVELPGAGHCFPLEQPEETVRALLDFLGTETTGRPGPPPGAP